MKQILLYITLAASLLHAACSTGDMEERQALERALVAAGNNRAELETVLAHYADNPEKLAAAKWLIMNMPGHYGYEGAELDSAEMLLAPIPHFKANFTIGAEAREHWGKFDFFALPKHSDLENISAAYLIDNIDRAYVQWKKRPWNANLPFDDFCELLLPYRVGDERLTDWRAAYEAEFSNRLDTAYTGNDILGACQTVMDIISEKGHIYNDELSTPHRDALGLLANRVGNCRDRCDLTALAMRSCGIPVTTDMLVASPENGLGHEWPVLRDNISGRYLPFGYDEMPLTRDSIAWDRRKKGKVYRPGFAGITDASDNYFGANTVSVDIEPNINEVALAVYARRGFRIIGMGEVKKGKAVFQNVEPNVILWVVTPQLKPSSMPFILRPDGKVETMQPHESMLTMTLCRKMPLTWRHRDWLNKELRGTCITAASADNPIRWDTLLTVDRPLDINFMEVRHKPGRRYDRIRIQPAESGITTIAELEVYPDTSASHRLDFNVATALPPRYSPQSMFDGNILTSFKSPPGMTIDYSLDNPSTIAVIRLIPRSDDNFVWPGDNYELSYFGDDMRWHALPPKTATSHSITFTAPAGAVYLLRDLTKGTEETPFIWRDGRQLFSLDLPVCLAPIERSKSH